MRIFLDTVGCRLNQSEIEAYARQFRAAGHTLVPEPGQADLVVVNTCTVTAAAASDSRQKIRQAARAGAGQIVPTGCWATLDPQVAASLPGVSRVVLNENKDDLVAGLLDIAPESFEREPIERELIPGARSRTRAFVKVQDGCDNRCTFCITTLARGSSRSRPVNEILSETRAVLQGESGASKEIVLTGVHLGAWGHDFAVPLALKHLVKAILKETDVPRLRLSSLEPWDLAPEFFELWEDPRLCRQLHLPLQSGCASTLRRMARKTTPESFADLVAAARAAIPGVAITTDVITGFPGEDEVEFKESLDFVRVMDFAGGHTFTYSARPGTAAAKMPAQVSHRTRKERNARMRAVLASSAGSYRQSFVGHEVEVLWESVVSLGPDSWQMSGLTGNYLRVFSHAPQHLWNQITPVQLTGLVEEGLSGVVQT